MPPRQMLFAAACLLACSGMAAQAQVSFRFIQADDAAKMVFDPARAKEASVIRSDGFRMSLSKHTDSTQIEKHMAVDEELILQEGDVVFNYGGEGVGAKETRPGEWTAQSMTGGKSVEMRPGDIVVVPANTWHQQILKSPRMRYILLQNAHKE